LDWLSFRLEPRRSWSLAGDRRRDKVASKALQLSSKSLLRLSCHIDQRLMNVILVFFSVALVSGCATKSA